jgi:GDP-fucose transporter C1
MPSHTCLLYCLADNVARCLSLVFNVIFTYLILGKTTSVLTCSTLLVVIVGFILGIQGEIDFSLIGTAAGVLSSVFVSLNSIYTARMLPVVENDKSMLLFYNNLNATVLFIPLIFMFESQVRSSH